MAKIGSYSIIATVLMASLFNQPSLANKPYNPALFTHSSQLASTLL